MGSRNQPSLPVIDFTEANLNPGSSLWLKTAKKVRNALEEHGCFIAINNKVSSELKDATFQELKHLFDLPSEIKAQNVCDIPHFAYWGKLSGSPLIEALGITKATDEESIRSFSNRMWPSGNDQFCGTMNSFIKSATKVEKMVKRMVFESYGVEKYLDSHVASTAYYLRCSKYRERTAEEIDFGAQAQMHTDKTFLTVIHQKGVDGVEVQTKNGDHWVKVEVPPSSSIVLAGEVFLAWSNGRIHSALHRVRMTIENEARYSLVLFSTTYGKTDIPEELIDNEHPRQFTSFDGNALRNFYFTEEGRKSENTARAYCGV